MTDDRRPPATPRFHRVRQASRNPLAAMEEILREYGDLVRWRGLTTMCIVNHPDLIRPVVTRDHHHFSKNTIQYRMLRQLMGNGLVTNDGPDWVRQRRLIQPAFASRRLARFDRTINELTSSLAARWEGQDAAEVVWLDREMSALTFDIVGETLFGRDIREHAGEMAEILEVVNVSSHDLRGFLTLWPWIPAPSNRKWKRAMKRLDRIIYGLMGRRGQGGDGSDDLLDRLFAARDEDTGEGMEERQIRDEVVTLILAGHETSAMALAWTLYLLATHPDIEARLVEHLDANLGGAPAATEDLVRLPYLKQVVQEAMRIYPPVWGFLRRTEQETALGNYTLPARAPVAVVTWALHRHPQFWPDPERFDPGRFAPERAEERDFFAYLPFAAGPRTCIGAGMAMLEIQLILAQLVPRFRMQVVPGHPIETEALVTLKPRHGIPVTLSPR